jgi:hypothetical protein
MHVNLHIGYIKSIGLDNIPEIPAADREKHLPRRFEDQAGFEIFDTTGMYTSGVDSIVEFFSTVEGNSTYESSDSDSETEIYTTDATEVDEDMYAPFASTDDSILQSSSSSFANYFPFK